MKIKSRLRVECTAQLAEEIRRELALADCPLAEILKTAEIISVDKPNKEPDDTNRNPAR